MKWRALILTVVLATVAAACGDPAGAPDPDHQGAPAGDPAAAADGADVATGISGSWILIDGVPLVDGFPITLVSDDSGLRGTAACNSYFGDVAIDEDSITIGQLGQTEMGCEPLVMDAEFAFMQALQAVTNWSIEDGLLTLTGPDTPLVFVAEQPAPIEALVGTTWILETLAEGDMAWMPIGDPALLTLHDDGTFEGSTGCRILTGRWVENGAQLDFPETAADGDCPADVREQDGLVVAVLGDGFRAVVDGQLLSIESLGNQALVYRASDSGDSTDLPQVLQPVGLASVCGHVDLGDAQDPAFPDAPLSATAQAALGPYLAMSEGEFGFFAGYEWFLAEETEDEIILFGRPFKADAEGFADARFELRDGEWVPSGWGSCHPTVTTGPDRSDWGLATWILDPDNPPDPNSTAIPVLINERNCANGEPPVDRAIYAQAVEEADALIITVLVEPIRGGANCPGNPWHPTVIDVNETPDGRQLYDGSVTPAEERTWPPSHPDYYEDE